MTGSRTGCEPCLLTASVAFLSATVLGLLALLYEATRRHGQALLRLEALESSQPAVGPTDVDPWEYLFQYGAPLARSA
jgi:hypothetical protein